MIPKVVRARDGKGSGGRGFKGAVEYVSGKADAVALRNVGSLKTAPREMRAVASESRLDKPVYHLALSWAALEHPTDEQAFAAADRALLALGLENHQAVIAVHRDRDHHHVHVVVNKRGLDGRTADLSHDFARLERVCREIEHQQGWAQDRGRFTPEIGEDGEITLAAKSPAREKKRADNKSERRSGREPLEAFLGRDDMHQQLAGAIDGAGTWEQLQAGLKSLGLHYEAKGSGARLISLTDPADTASPSHLDKTWARSRLEQRLGPITANAPTPTKGEKRGNDLTAIGRTPPPAARNRLRNLSELPVVRFPGRSEVLLPGHVSGDLVNARTEPDRSVRRPATRVAPRPEVRQTGARTPYQDARERLWQAFQREKQATYQRAVLQRRQARETLYKRHQAEREQVVAHQRHRRKTLDILFGRRGVTRWIFRHWDGRRRSSEWAELNARQQAEKAALRESRCTNRVPTPEWRAFLDEQVRTGNRDAELVARATKLARAPEVQRANGYGNSANELAAMRRIDLVTLANDMGYAVDARESTQASVKLRKGADVVIAQPGQDGSWSYFNTGNDRDSGGVIQFVQARQGGTLGEVRQFLRPYLQGLDRAEASPAPVEQERDHTAARQAWMAAKTVMPAYLQQRGIDRVTVEALASDQVRQDGRGNVLFAHRDQTGNVVGFEVKGKAWSGFAKGGQKTLSIFGTPEARQQAARIIVVESGIDALSLGQMERRRDTLYVSTGGAVGRRTLDELRTLAERHPQAAVALGFDNDEAGQKLAERVVHSLNKAAEHLRPRAKDWNEDLQASLRAVEASRRVHKMRQRTRSQAIEL